MRVDYEDVESCETCGKAIALVMLDQLDTPGTWVHVTAPEEAGARKCDAKATPPKEAS